MIRPVWRRTLPLTLIITVILTLVVAACGATPTPTATPVPPTPTRPPSPTATVPPTATTAPAVPTATKALATALPVTPQTAAPTATTAPGSATVSFSKDIQPIFQKSCIRCHGGSNPRSGLSLENYQNAMKGGNNAPDIVPGNPDNSPIYTLVKSGTMPFGGPRLSDADVQKIYDWIKAGAPNN